MALDSKGCLAVIKKYLKETPKCIICEAYTCYTKIVSGRKKYVPDFIDRMIFYKKGDLQLHKGDIIKIHGFFIKNSMDNCCVNKFYNVIVPEWEISCRNHFVEKYYKRKISGELEQERLEKKRRELEEELESEEQDLDEYIENNGEDGIPF